MVMRKVAFYGGWAITLLMVTTFVVSAVFKVIGSTEVEAEFGAALGYSTKLFWPIAILEIVCALLYLWPQTSMLGAVLLTAYAGGAVASHVRVLDDEMSSPIICGVLVWAGIYLREPRLWTLLPWRTSPRDAA